MILLLSLSKTPRNLCSFVEKYQITTKVAGDGLFAKYYFENSGVDPDGSK